MARTPKNGPISGTLVVVAIGLWGAATAGPTAPTAPWEEAGRFPSTEEVMEHMRARSEASARSPVESGVDASAIAALPALELNVSRDVGLSPASDGFMRALADGANGVCIVAIEGSLLRSLASSDGGVTFDSEVDVVDRSTALPVSSYAIDRSPAGDVFAAMSVTDPNGGLRIQVVRSGDLCRTWSEPVDVLLPGDAEAGPLDLALSAGASNHVSVGWIAEANTRPFVSTSTDQGVTWSTPVRPDPDLGPMGSRPTSEIELFYEGTTLHVAFIQDRAGRAGNTLLLTRSTDSGASFATPINADTLVFGAENMGLPRFASFGADNVNVAYWVSFGSSVSMNVARSTDGGVGYASSFAFNHGDNPVWTPPSWGDPKGGSTVLLAYGYNGFVSFARSTDLGATYAAVPTAITSGDACGGGFGEQPNRVRVVGSGTGDWSLSWSDCSSAGAGVRADVRVNRSSDDGVSFGPAQLIDGDGAGVSISGAPDLVAPRPDDALVTFVNDRNNEGGNRDVYVSRSVGGAAFGSDMRVDTDAVDADALGFIGPGVASDGAGRVYVASNVSLDIYVHRSDDGGYTFGTPVRVGSTPAGERLEFMPLIAATSDGYVYVTWISDDATTGTREVRFAASSDFGETWTSDTVLGTDKAGPGGSLYFQNPHVDMAALPGGTIYVTWSDLDDVFLARSFDGGVTLDIDDVDQNSNGANRLPNVCAVGSRVVLLTMSPDIAFSFFSVWGIVSDDNGATWAPRVQLRPEGIGNGADTPDLACDSAGNAVATWADARSGVFQTRSSRYDGTSWSADALVSGPPGQSLFWQRVEFATDDEPWIAYQTSGGEIWLAPSTDGGVSFPSSQRLDGTLSRASAPSNFPDLIVTGGDTGTEKVWVAWIESAELSPLNDVVVRYSGDGGASFGPVRRLSSGCPGGGCPNFFLTPWTKNVSENNAAIFGFVGGRTIHVGGFADATLVNVYDPDDLDRDQVLAGSDCDDEDPSASLDPTLVVDLALQKQLGGDTLLTWADQSSTGGASTRYEVVRGALADLLSSGDFSAATCLASDLEDASYLDTDAAPAPGEGTYDLVRALNGCGGGSFGDSTLASDPRDALDAGSPCP